MYPMVSGSTDSVQGDTLVSSPASSTTPRLAGDRSAQPPVSCPATSWSICWPISYRPLSRLEV